MTRKIGSFCEKGILNSWFRMGFNNYKCIMELIANSIDANATQIRFSIVGNILYITDNGNGMDEKGFINFTCLHYQNHKNEKKCGVGGIGGKSSFAFLSNKKYTKIYSCNSNANEWHYADFNWDKIYSEGKYTDNVGYSKISNDSIIISTLNLLMKDNTNGTIIELPCDENLKNIVNEMFKKPKDRKTKFNLSDSPEYVFGEFNNVKIELYNSNKKIEMLKYNYFINNNEHYYDGISEVNIGVYESNNNSKLYISEHEGVFKYYTSEVAKKPKTIKDKNELNEILKDYDKIGNMKLKYGQRNDSKNIQSTNPFSYVSKYELDFIKEFDNNIEKNKTCERLDNIRNTKFYRNNQLIGDIKSEKGNARANHKECHKHYGVRSCLYYETESSQDNKMDETLHIQNNKNQWDHNDLDKSLKKLITYHIGEKHKKIWSEHYEKAPIEKEVVEVKEEVVELKEEVVELKEEVVEVKEEVVEVKEEVVELKEEVVEVKEEVVELKEEVVEVNHNIKLDEGEINRINKVYINRKFRIALDLLILDYE